MQYQPLLLSLLILLIAMWVPAARANSITLTDLGAIDDDVADINDSGQITGTLTVVLPYGNYYSRTFHAFSYSNGLLSDLGTLPGGFSSVASGINGTGQIVGYSTVAGGAQHAFLYSQGVMTDIDTGYQSSMATAINNSGQIVGSLSAPNGFGDAFLYSGGVMTDLGTLPGFVGSVAMGINDSGQVVGRLFTANGTDHAFLYSNGILTDLGTLGGNSSAAVDINNAGQIVGTSTDSFGNVHAFLYSRGIMSDLGSFGGTTVTVSSINASGQILGTSQIPSPLQGLQPTYIPFLYLAGTTTKIASLLPLNSLWELQSVTALNDSGEMAGVASFYGNDHLITLDTLAAPEPSSFALLIAALGASCCGLLWHIAAKLRTPGVSQQKYAG